MNFNEFLIQAGYNSYLIVKDVKTVYPYSIKYPQSFEKLTTKLQRKLSKQQYTEADTNYDYYFYNLYDRFDTVSAQKILNLLPAKPDLIFIHWVSDFINAKILSELQQMTSARVFILMLDNAPITGGCHYPWDCRQYCTDCSDCPAILKSGLKAISQKNLALKKKYLPADSTLLVFSDNDFNRARQSALFANKSILKLPGYFVDEKKFSPGNQSDAKAKFNIPEHHHVVFFGATSLNEKRKGMHLLLNSLEYLTLENVTYLVAGSMPPSDQFNKFTLVGNLTEDQLINAYRAADMFVCPTLEDSGPTMINQAIMCGTPVVSFNTGIGGDLVQTGKTGYQALFNDPKDLAKGITYLYNLSENERIILRKNCRDFAIELYGGMDKYKEKILEIINS